MPKYNELHDIVAALVAEKKDYAKDADKANAVQYGTVRFSNRAEAVRWWEKLPPAKKQEHLQKNGNESVLKMLRGSETGGTV
jgi:hypothetical protein